MSCCNLGRGEDGQIILLTALLLPVLFGLAGLAFDLSFLFSQRQAAQMAADAAAQAGAIAMAKGYSVGTVTADALKYAALDGFTSANSTIQVNVPPKSPPALQSYGSDHVQVVITVDTTPWLSRAIGIKVLSSTSQAVATAAGPTSGILLLVLDPTASGAVTAGEESCLSAIGGAIDVNSSSATAINTNGGQDGCEDDNGYSLYSSVGTNVVGGWTSGCCQPVAQNGPVVADPLSALPRPAYSNGQWLMPDGTPIPQQSSSQLSIGGSATLNPGVYVGGISIGSGAWVTMNPGVYVIDGGGISDSGSLSGSGVFIYNSSSTGSYGGLSFAAAGLSLSPPTAGAYKGLVLAQDPANTNQATLSGDDSAAALSGTVYLPTARLKMGEESTLNLSAQLIVGQIKMGEESAINVTSPPVEYSPPMASLVE